MVQLGDQIDAGGGKDKTTGQDKFRHERRVHHDLETLLFTDYLQTISKGHFINIIGNHEWMNALNEFKYVHLQNAYDARKGHFDPQNGLMAYILKRRHFLCCINNAVFSHAGLHGRALTRLGVQLQDLLDDTWVDRFNEFLDDDKNFRDPRSDRLFEAVIYNGDPTSNDISLLWNRKHDITGVVDNKQDISPQLLFDKLDININVTGHNKYRGDKILLGRRKGSGEVEVIQVSAEDKGGVVLTSDNGERYLVACDNMKETTKATDKTSTFLYAEFRALNSSGTFEKMYVHKSECGGDIACPLIPPVVDEYLRCRKALPPISTGS